MNLAHFLRRAPNWMKKAVVIPATPITTIRHTAPVKRNMSSLVQEALKLKKEPTSAASASDKPEEEVPLFEAHDILSQHVREGAAARSPDNFGIDGASPNIALNEEDKTVGNPEGIGMLEQVGSATGTARFFEQGGKQGAQQPK
ncbi:hypothetical protein M413DRAFT_446088 [Hebeloma cylindrosporum]|uniref:Uncharacterized protein n=1 Tax=Hebeloma cylindrosporum TaxID=76867 RepID=A0A0C3BVN3_HEBCY|nr:hypothetical protein M413DRAFT_446088 [Hebeloma cylindrosporum h7]